MSAFKIQHPQLDPRQRLRRIIAGDIGGFSGLIDPFVAHSECCFYSDPFDVTMVVLFVKYDMTADLRIGIYDFEDVAFAEPVPTLENVFKVMREKFRAAHELVRRNFENGGID